VRERYKPDVPAIPHLFDLTGWRQVLDTGLTGAFPFAQAAVREMLRRQYRPVHVSNQQLAIGNPHSPIRH
jgi:NAD(P)-dependent dehydrogenase (short-subunit alcohol dehydrogenase family)